MISAGIFYSDLPFLGKMGKCQLLQHPLSLVMELNCEHKHFAEDCSLLQTLTLLVCTHTPWPELKQQILPKFRAHWEFVILTAMVLQLRALGRSLLVISDEDRGRENIKQPALSVSLFVR